ncbi:TetR/AcrR family transcriptional regulator [Rhodocyclus tenuis]|uniref:AcrR family transcriptional regulator n=1 Tax=Rhodocyclus tenuis TaxID=1066 RepID=A0A840FWR3_RHOTE|nr:TetR/AcrR family transcriptional regulator [Rhodocyclus tenuis]MBB4246214.1 AcrR family transcriptional regulator [Rhodocyclus tenuis]
MTQTPDTHHEQSRAAVRRAQVLKAATECFRLHGFHSTSIVQISKAAGMSVGHIYHYFANKEAIIAGIVEQDLQQVLMFCERIRKNSAGGDLIEAMVDDLRHFKQDMQEQDIPLTLEVVAEAARNPAVAAIVQAADQTVQLRFRELLAEAMQLRGLEIDEKECVGTLEALSALFDGLAMRLVRNPQLDPETCVPALRSLLAHALEELATKARRKSSAH